QPRKRKSPAGLVHPILNVAAPPNTDSTIPLPPALTTATTTDATLIPTTSVPINSPHITPAPITGVNPVAAAVPAALANAVVPSVPTNTNIPATAQTNTAVPSAPTAALAPATALTNTILPTASAKPSSAAKSKGKGKAQRPAVPAQPTALDQSPVLEGLDPVVTQGQDYTTSRHPSQVPLTEDQSGLVAVEGIDGDPNSAVDVAALQREVRTLKKFKVLFLDLQSSVARMDGTCKRPFSWNTMGIATTPFWPLPEMPCDRQALIEGSSLTNKTQLGLVSAIVRFILAVLQNRRKTEQAKLKALKDGLKKTSEPGKSSKRSGFKPRPKKPANESGDAAPHKNAADRFAEPPKLNSTIPPASPTGQQHALPSNARANKEQMDRDQLANPGPSTSGQTQVTANALERMELGQDQTVGVVQATAEAILKAVAGLNGSSNQNPPQGPNVIHHQSPKHRRRGGLPVCRTSSSIAASCEICKDLLELLSLRRLEPLLGPPPPNLRYPTTNHFYIDWTQPNKHPWNVQAREIVYSHIQSQEYFLEELGETRLQTKISKHFTDLRKKWERKQNWAPSKVTSYKESKKKYSRKERKHSRRLRTCQSHPNFKKFIRLYDALGVEGMSSDKEVIPDPRFPKVKE
ncbi:hypothetical protein FRB90_000330, partial [Tulasnella sp. 427]